ncbi:DUF6049 family protein [Actinomyces faecalis]|uniref:DUF6049 family protein n=1 Tax=Actinomyces faecalis TaxID=2722820 RepID=UPI00155403BB|nr:DUF6049 family protein [Actinomyces faecalis]
MRLGRARSARRRPTAIAHARSATAGVCAVLALGLAGVATVPVPASQAAVMTAPLASRTTVRSAAEVVEGQVTTSVDSLSAEVLASDQDLTINGTIANGTDSALSSVRLAVRVQRSTEVTTAALGSWLAAERTGYLSTVATLELDGEVAPGTVRGFSLTVPAADLPFTSAEQWGPRGVEVQVLQDGEEVSSDRTVVVWDADVEVDATRVTAIVPVVASADEMSLLATASVTDPAPEDGTSAEAASSPSPSQATASQTSLPETEDGSGQTASQHDAVDDLVTRVTGLLSLAGPGVVLAVDPALMEVLGATAEPDESQAEPEGSSTDSPDAPQAPQQATTAQDSPSDPASDDASPLPAASATPANEAGGSPSGPAAAAAGDHPRVAVSSARLAELRQAVRDALTKGTVIALPWADADLTALAHLGQVEEISSALARSQQAVGSWDDVVTTTVLATGPLDTTTLDLLPQSVTSVVAQAGDLAVSEDLTYTPSGGTSTHGRTVLVPETDLTAALAGQLPAASADGEQVARTGSELDTRQLIRAESAILTRQAPNRHRNLVVTVSREDAARTSPEVLGKRLGSLLSSSWTSAQDLTGLLDSVQQEQEAGTQAERSQPPQTDSAPGELTQEELVEARQLSSDLASIASVLSSPSPALGTATDVTSWAAATSWRSDAEARTAYLDQARSAGTAVTSRVTVVPSSTINVISSSADLPLRIQSGLDQEVTVQVRLRPSSTRLQAVKDVTATVPAHGQVSVTIPIKAVGSGDVDVHITLLSADGTPVGTPLTLHTRVRADWESLGTTVIAAVLAVMLVVGIVRTVRRGRRSDADGQSLKAPATAGARASTTEAG